MPLPAFFVEIIMPIINASPTRRLVFQYLVPVHVEVEARQDDAAAWQVRDCF